MNPRQQMRQQSTSASQPSPPPPPSPGPQAASRQGTPTPSPFSITLTPCKMLADRIVPDGREAVVCDTRGFGAILTLRPDRVLLQQLAQGRYLVVLGSPAQAIIVPDRVGLRAILKKNPGLDRRIKSYWHIDQIHRGGTVCET